jgi:hypothetical protein
MNVFLRPGRMNDGIFETRLRYPRASSTFPLKTAEEQVEAKNFVPIMGTYGAEGVNSATGYPTGVDGCCFLRTAKGEPLHHG